LRYRLSARLVGYDFPAIWDHLIDWRIQLTHSMSYPTAWRS